MAKKLMMLIVVAAMFVACADKVDKKNGSLIPGSNLTQNPGRSGNTGNTGNTSQQNFTSVKFELIDESTNQVVTEYLGAYDSYTIRIPSVQCVAIDPVLWVLDSTTFVPIYLLKNPVQVTSGCEVKNVNFNGITLYDEELVIIDVEYLIKNDQRIQITLPQVFEVNKSL